jgi:hypothetical protein
MYKISQNYILSCPTTFIFSFSYLHQLTDLFKIRNEKNSFITTGSTFFHFRMFRMLGRVGATLILRDSITRLGKAADGVIG